MKLLLLQLLLLLACYTLTAQQTSGFGPFTIGRTTIATIDSLKKSGYTYEESPDWTAMLRKKSTRIIILLKADASGLISNSKTKPTEGLAVYNVGTLEGKGPKADNLIMSFYKDTLCAIISNNYGKDFTKLEKQRLGQPKDSVHATKIDCGARKNLMIADTISTYIRTTAIRVYEARGFYYDKQCNKKEKYFFEISNPAIMQRLAKSSNSFDLIFPYLFF